MPVGMDALTADLAEETAALRALLAGLDDAGWGMPTPAANWAVRDQVSHLAYFDDVALRSATDPEAFDAERAGLMEFEGRFTEEVAQRHRHLSGPDLLAWFDASRARLIETFAGLDPALRVPWFGPTMSAASSLTARLMETWAHGQDIEDTVPGTREPTDRLRHVAHIGVRALPFSFALHGREVPSSPIRVELTSPGGELWTWGPAEALDSVTGSALDFCLAVTQRRHRADTALVITGPAAAEWMSIAQAFAGRAGPGRPRRS